MYVVVPSLNQIFKCCLSRLVLLMCCVDVYRGNGQMLRYRYVPKRSTRGEADDAAAQGGLGQTTLRGRRQSPGPKVQTAGGALSSTTIEGDPQTDNAGGTDNGKDTNKEASSGMHQPRRRKKRPIHGVKTVAVTRGRSGYGFTISGQHPCVLSCIVAGSPAELAGLKPGDYLVAVNCENVSRYSHDDVVRMVGMSTGTLELQVAENYNSSDSSDDDYPPRTKSRYPNRVRPRQGYDRSTKENGRHSNSDLNHVNGRSNIDGRGDNPRLKHRTVVGGESETSQNSSLTEGTSQERIYSSDQSAFHQYVSNKISQKHNSRSNLKQQRDSKQNLRQDSNSDLQNGHSRSSLHRHKPPPPHRSSKPSLPSHLQTSKSNLNGMDNATISSTGSVQFQELHSQNISGFQGMFPTSGIVSSHGLSTSGMSDPNNPSPGAGDVEGAVAAAASPGYPEDDDSFDMHQPVGDIKAVVGYIGSIEMPSNSSRPHQRIQSLRNAVRRLRIEQKIHTLVLMNVDSDGVKLTNAMGASIAHYPVDMLAFSGVCPDDKRFFGIVTLHNPSDDMSELSVQREDSPSASSCHIFMVDPELRSHNIHAQKAKAFNIKCTVDPETQRCLEFPRSATPIILSVANLYKDRPRGVYENDIVQSQALADPVRAVQRSSSNSSNSDSGLGFGRDDKVNERVYVVDMPVEAPANDQPQPGANRILQHLSPDISTMPTPKHSFTRPQSAMEIRRGLNTSTSSEECWQGSKLNPRAMPDPISLWRAKSSDDLERQNNAETLRQSMHKLLQARQRHASEHHLSSDTESHDSREGFLSRNGFSAPRPMSAPFAQLNFIKSEKVEAVDLAVGKLSPRAFHGVQHAKFTGRSPSAPPIPYYHGDDDDDDDSDEEDDPFVRGIISRLNRDKALGLSNEDSRRYSEGFALARKREKERTDVAALQKWTKTGSFRRNRGMKIQNPLSHSHESLIAGDGDQSIHKLLPANSVNSIVAQVAQKEEKDDVGRVAGWAVNFDKLLRDQGGIVVFTEFLKKEFSEENIVFWRVCEHFKQLTSDDERKSKSKEIFAKHLSSKASEPVNVDSASRLNAEKHLDNPTVSMFDMAQKHIFQLMKQDSYARFLKSEVYKTYLMREIEGKPLNLPQDDMAEAITGKDSKKNGKGKENEKRRRSLLPWRQNKNKHGNSKVPSDSDLKRGAKDIKIKDKEVNNNLKKCPGPGIDLSTMRKEVFQTKEEMHDPNEGQFKFCRVVLPDGSTTVVCAKPGQSSRSVLGKLCEKRGLSIAAVDVFMLGSDKPLDLSEDVSSLGSKEVVIERRVLFRMDFPNKKSIGVKAKPNRSIRDVFKPILNKYGYRIENILVQLSGHEEFLDVDMLVLALDNQRVVILSKEETLDWVGEERPGMSSTHHRPPLPPTTSRHKSGSQGNVKAGSLDEITNRIFEDLMKGKSETAHSFDELGIVELEKTKGHKNPDEHRLSGLFGLLRRESVGKAKDNKQKSTAGRNKVTFALQKNESRQKRSDPEDERLFELLTRAQSQRLDDQRGVSTDVTEIPEFLRTEMPEPTCGPPGHRQSDMFDDVEYIHGHGQGRLSRGYETPPNKPADVTFQSGSKNVHNISSFGTPGFTHSNQSFSSDGHMPSQEVGDDYFQMQPVVLDASEFDMENIENFHMANVQQEHHWSSMPRTLPSHQRTAQSPHPNPAQHAAPIASPEKYSPHKHYTDHLHEQQMCEAIDQTFKNKNSKSFHPTRSPVSPPLIPHKLSTNYTPPPPLSEIENNGVNTSSLRHSETSSFHRVLKHSGKLKDLHSVQGNENLYSQHRDELNHKLSQIPSGPGATPKHLGNRSSDPVVVDVNYEEETVTFV